MFFGDWPVAGELTTWLMVRPRTSTDKWAVAVYTGGVSLSLVRWLGGLFHELRFGIERENVSVHGGLWLLIKQHVIPMV